MGCSGFSFSVSKAWEPEVLAPPAWARRVSPQSSSSPHCSPPPLGDVWWARPNPTTPTQSAPVQWRSSARLKDRAGNGSGNGSGNFEGIFFVVFFVFERIILMFFLCTTSFPVRVFLGPFCFSLMLQKCRRALGSTLSSVTFLCGVRCQWRYHRLNYAPSPSPPHPRLVQPKPKQVNRSCCLTSCIPLLRSLMVHSEGPPLVFAALPPKRLRQ